MLLPGGCFNHGGLIYIAAKRAMLCDYQATRHPVNERPTAQVPLCDRVEPRQHCGARCQ